MMRMRARPAVRRAQGPFVLPARTLLLASGLLAVALGGFTLFHEFRSGQVDGVYTIIAVIVGGIWLTCLVLAFLGVRLAVFAAPAIAFVESGVIASGHSLPAPGPL